MPFLSQAEHEDLGAGQVELSDEEYTQAREQKMATAKSLTEVQEISRRFPPVEVLQEREADAPDEQLEGEERDAVYENPDYIAEVGKCSSVDEILEVQRKWGL